MSLVVEKLLEYLKFSDSQCENIVGDIATQYESLIDQALNLNNLPQDVNQMAEPIIQKRTPVRPGASDAELNRKDLEIKKL